MSAHCLSMYICRKFISECFVQKSHATVVRRFYKKGLRNGKSYQEYVNVRLDQARRSVYVHHPDTPYELFETCEKFGRVQEFRLFQGGEKHFAIVQYENESSVKKLMQNTPHFPNDTRIPVDSRNLFFSKPLSMRRGQGKPTRGDRKNNTSFAKNCIHHKDEGIQLKDSDLLLCPSVSDQIITLHRKLSMSELDIRKRFFLCICIEDVSKGILPYSTVRPFGSCVSGIGRKDCDVDMVLHYEDDAHIVRDKIRVGTLYFLSKRKPEKERHCVQDTLGVLSGILQHLQPLYSYVHRILHARVPIVSFKHMGIGLDGDISMENESAVQMSELLYYLGQVDERFKQLLFTIRHWARYSGVTQTHPGPWFSSRNSEETCSLVGRYSASQSQNEETLDELLLEFFEMYAKMDFKEQGISLLTGSLLPKPDEVDVYVENPLESKHNIAKNVIGTELDKFQTQCGHAADALRVSRQRTVDQPWGLLEILKADFTEEDADDSLQQQPRLDVKVGDLFSQDTVDQNVDVDSEPGKISQHPQ